MMGNKHHFTKGPLHLAYKFYKCYFLFLQILPFPSMICAIIFTEEKKENLFGMGSTYIYRVFNPYQRESTYHLPNSLICVKGETFTF